MGRAGHQIQTHKIYCPPGHRTGERNYEMRHSDTSVFVQRGSSSTLRVSDEDKYYVIEEVWEGSKLLNTYILSSHSSPEGAQIACEEEQTKA